LYTRHEVTHHISGIDLIGFEGAYCGHLFILLVNNSWGFIFPTKDIDMFIKLNMSTAATNATES
jgi:hypothetical protein